MLHTERQGMQPERGELARSHKFYGRQRLAQQRGNSEPLGNFRIFPRQLVIFIYTNDDCARNVCHRGVSLRATAQAIIVTSMTSNGRARPRVADAELESEGWR